MIDLILFCILIAREGAIESAAETHRWLAANNLLRLIGQGDSQWYLLWQAKHKLIVRVKLRVLSRIIYMQLQIKASILSISWLQLCYLWR